MSIFGQAIDAARTAEPARQAREFEKHLRTHGLDEVSSMSKMLALKKAFPRVSADEFEEIVDRVRKQIAKRRKPRI